MEKSSTNILFDNNDKRRVIDGVNQKVISFFIVQNTADELEFYRKKK